jgi:hypothetical protein
MASCSLGPPANMTRLATSGYGKGWDTSRSRSSNRALDLAHSATVERLCSAIATSRPERKHQFDAVGILKGATAQDRFVRRRKRYRPCSRADEPTPWLDEGRPAPATSGQGEGLERRRVRHPAA